MAAMAAMDDDEWGEWGPDGKIDPWTGGSKKVT